MKSIKEGSVWLGGNGFVGVYIEGEGPKIVKIHRRGLIGGLKETRERSKKTQPRRSLRYKNGLHRARLTRKKLGGGPKWAYKKKKEQEDSMHNNLNRGRVPARKENKLVS